MHHVAAASLFMPRLSHAYTLLSSSSSLSRWHDCSPLPYIYIVWVHVVCLWHVFIMPKAIFKKNHGVSRRVNVSQPSGSRYTKPFPPKTLNMTELSKDRERSRKLYTDQVLSAYLPNTHVCRTSDPSQLSIPAKRAHWLISMAPSTHLTTTMHFRKRSMKSTSAQVCWVSTSAVMRHLSRCVRCQNSPPSFRTL